MWTRISVLCALSIFVSGGGVADVKEKFPEKIQMVLEKTEPLKFERGKRLPLYLWPAMNVGDVDDETAEAMIKGLENGNLTKKHFTGTYLRACKQTIYPELKNALLFRNIIFGRYRHAAFRAVAKDPKIREHAVRIIQGEGTYSDMIKFLIKRGIKIYLRMYY